MAEQRQRERRAARCAAGNAGAGWAAGGAAEDGRGRATAAVKAECREDGHKAEKRAGGRPS